MKTMKRKILFIICYLLFVICSIKADWVKVNNGLNILSVNTLCSYTSGGVNYIFAGTLYGGGHSGVIFVSTNNGNSRSVRWNIPNDVYSLSYISNHLFPPTANGLGYTNNHGTNCISAKLHHCI